MPQNPMFKILNGRLYRKGKIVKGFKLIKTYPHSPTLGTELKVFIPFAIGEHRNREVHPFVSRWTNHETDTVLDDELNQVRVSDNQGTLMSWPEYWQPIF